MDYSTPTAIPHLLLLILLLPTKIAPITTRTDPASVRNFRRHAGPLPPTDWTPGLREAVHQALLREHIPDAELRGRLLAAPFLGRHDAASPFGDIAVLGRGQLYATAAGFKFVQDQDDCDECHAPNGCPHKPHCQPWRNPDYSKLLALWTAKRIRHRDDKHGFTFEIEYTIAPITHAISEDILMRHGFFNYNVPGHIFVIRSDPRLNSAYYTNNNKFQHDEGTHHEHNNNQDDGDMKRKPGIVIGIEPNGYKQVLHTFPGFFTSYRPETMYPDQTTIDPKEYELYKKLIESLAAKTVPSNGFTPHRFALTTTTKQDIPLTVGYYPGNTLAHFPDENGNAIPSGTTIIKQTPTVPVRFPGESKYRDSNTLYYTQATVPVIVPQHSDIFDDPVIAPSQAPRSTTPLSTSTSKKQDFHTEPFIVTIPEPQTKQLGTTQSQTVQSTKFIETTTLPKKTTPAYKETTKIHYYTAVDEAISSTTKLRTKKPKTYSTKPKSSTTKFTTQAPFEREPEEFDLFPVVPTEALARDESTTKKKSTTKFTTQAPFTREPEEFDLFPVVPTEALTRDESTTKKKSTTQNFILYPESISDQLPPPDKNTETTIPYVSTVTQAPITIPVTLSTINLMSSAGTQIIPTTKPTIKTTANFDEILATTEESYLRTTRKEGKEKSNTFSSNETPLVETTIKYVNIKPEPEPSLVATDSEKIPSTNFYPPTTDIYTAFNTKNPFDEPTSTIFLTSMNHPDRKTTKYEEIEQTNQSTKPQTSTTIHEEYFPTETKPYFESMGTTTLQITKNETTQSPDSTNFGDIETSTNKYKKSKPTKKIASSGDFLDTVKQEKTITPNKEINDDDIFGEAPLISSAKPESTTLKKESTQSDLAEALFGGRRSKQIKASSKLLKDTTTSLTVTPKIIYSNFYKTATEPTTLNYKTTPLFDQITNNEETTLFTTTERRPITDTSVSTSISFEVNKKNHPTSTNQDILLEPTIKAEVTEIIDPIQKYKIFKAEFPIDMTTERYENAKILEKPKHVFDNFALQLVNHARTIDYFSNKTSTTSQPKYKRRRYDPKRRPSQRRLS